MCKSAQFLPLLACLLLASCFDSREEIWIAPDGSGRAELSVTLPGAALLLAGGRDGVEAKVRRFFDETPQLELDSLAFEAAGDEMRVRLAASAESMLDLMDLQQSESFAELPAAATSSFGRFAVEIDGLDINYQRTIDIGKGLGFATLAIPAAEKDERRLVYIAHLPTKAKQHNAGEVSADGRTLTWNYTLGEAIAEPIHHQARIPMPIPWLRILLIVLAIAIAATVLGRRFRLQAQRKKSTPSV